MSYNNGAERLRLPVNPESIQIESSYGYEDVEIASLGEYTLFGNQKLRSFYFSSFFPAEYNPSYCEYVSIPDPKTCIEIIERWQRAKSPIRFAVTGALGGSINYAATIRTFNYEERAGSPGDWYYDLELREYRFITIRTIATTATATSAVTSATSESERPSTWEPPSSYTVKSGDSLWKISAEVYKDGGVGWSKIYDANVGVIGKDPNLIYPGQVLTIPG